MSFYVKTSLTSGTTLSLNVWDICHLVTSNKHGWGLWCPYINWARNTSKQLHIHVHIHCKIYAMNIKLPCVILVHVWFIIDFVKVKKSLHLLEPWNSCSQYSMTSWLIFYPIKRNLLCVFNDGYSKYSIALSMWDPNAYKYNVPDLYMYMYSKGNLGLLVFSIYKLPASTRIVFNLRYSISGMVYFMNLISVPVNRAWL